MIQDNPLTGSFGDIVIDVDDVYHPGMTARAHFVGANPRVRSLLSIRLQL